MTRVDGMPSLDLSATSVELAQAVCDVASVSGEEAMLADLIEQALAPYEHLEVVRHGNTVVARTSLGRAQRVVLAGHIDTVPVNGNLPTQRRDDEDGPVLWGRGTVDMKSFVAIQLKLAPLLVEPRVDLTWMFYDNEEVTSDLNGLKLLAESRPDLFEADFAILGEPSNAIVEGGCNGTLRVVVRTRGVRAHSARAWMGENAIHAAAPILARLAEYRPKEVTVDGLAYREGLNAVRIGGGVAGNVIPDLCEVEVNYRFAPDKTPEKALEHVVNAFEGFEVEPTDIAPGARPGLDAPLAQAFIAAVGGTPRPKYGWTDVARFSAMGVPAVNYGPGDPSLAHHDDERVPLEQIEAVERGLRAWLA